MLPKAKIRCVSLKTEEFTMRMSKSPAGWTGIIKRYSRVLASLLFVSSFLTFSSGIASAGVYSFSLCYDTVSVQCIWTDGTSGHPLYNKAYFANGIAQTYSYVPAECGKVGPSCTPFTSGTGLNIDLAGSPIVTLKNVHYGNCINLYWSATEGPCTGSNNEVFVLYTEPDDSEALISVATTNNAWTMDFRTHAAYGIVGNTHINGELSGALEVYGPDSCVLSGGGVCSWLER